ncbi:MAG TPA: hypothetical protein VFB96_03380 [Pirellulaceae bacterium]|jgi:hypothetical protein|nr:hypothetical protein [Pirellulaceae bacterium]
MGSFANSLHVRSDDLAPVVDAVQTALRGEGFEPTDEELDADARWGMSASLRGIHISEPREGWVAILENDPLSSVALAADVSKRLGVHAIQFFVNDSDSWHYQLFHRGQQIDSFDSSDEEGEDWDDEEFGSGESLVAGGLAQMEQAIRGKAQEFEALLTAGMPPEVRAIHGKMQTGQVTPPEMQQYMQWMNAEMPKRMADMQRLVGEAMEGLRGERGKESGDRSQESGEKGQESGGRRQGAGAGPAYADDQELLKHVQRLEPLLAPGTPSDQVLEILGRQAVFAEETLGEFLPLVGIAPVYAHLSYRYLEEFSESELASQSVKMAAHLRFRSGFEQE